MVATANTSDKAASAMQRTALRSVARLTSGLHRTRRADAPPELADVQQQLAEVKQQLAQAQASAAQLLDQRKMLRRDLKEAHEQHVSDEKMIVALRNRLRDCRDPRAVPTRVQKEGIVKEAEADAHAAFVRMQEQSPKPPEHAALRSIMQARRAAGSSLKKVRRDKLKAAKQQAITVHALVHV